MNNSGRPDDRLLDCESLDVRVPGRQLVESLNFELRRGEVVAVLGRNGTGKTLTLTTLAGLRTPDAGVVRLLGSDIAQVKRRQVARSLALLPQIIDDIFPATVMDTALIGRHPHIEPLGWESREDYAAARAALQKAGLDSLAERDIFTLSGGERRRLAIAQVLTQAPDIYLLDEPTNHLDPQHQLDTLQVFRRVADDGAGVIASMHDVNLAVRFADRCLLLFGDGRWRLGETREILDEDTLGELYATQMEAVTWRSQKLFVPASGNPPA
ncbi:MAG: ABC transporter ATP-binding protein [Woeseiaceae bacterium]|nr:ABC transporter ATP-binding protein [Woeseiaceae bacterium]